MDDLMLRKITAINALNRYGCDKIKEETLKLLEVLVDINDDLEKGRTKACVMLKIDTMRRQLTDLENSLE